MGDCNVGLVSDFGSDYSMMSTNRYHSNIVATGSVSSSEGTGNGGNVVEINPSTNDQHNHYAQVQSNGSTVSGTGSGNNSTVNSSQLFHSHHNMGHFAPSAAAFISGPGYIVLFSIHNFVSSQVAERFMNYNSTFLDYSVAPYNTVFSL